VVVAVLLATGVVGGSGVDADRELELPSTLGDGLVVEADNELWQQGDPEVRAARDAVRAETAEHWSDAYDGAAAAVAAYSDEEGMEFVQLVAVAAPSPGLVAPGDDAELLGLELPRQELRTFDEVECLLENRPVGEGQELPDDATRVLRCQRTSDDLTVVADSVSGDQAHDPAAVAGIVDEAFESLG
jgi:hypothetical protein